MFSRSSIPSTVLRVFFPCAFLGAFSVLLSRKFFIVCSIIEIFFRLVFSSVFLPRSFRRRFLSVQFRQVISTCYFAGVSSMRCFWSVFPCAISWDFLSVTSFIGDSSVSFFLKFFMHSFANASPVRYLFCWDFLCALIQRASCQKITLACKQPVSALVSKGSFRAFFRWGFWSVLFSCYSFLRELWCRSFLRGLFCR